MESNIELQEPDLMKTKKSKLKSEFKNYFDTPIDSLIAFLPYSFWENHLKETNQMADPNKSTTFKEAWNHENKQEQEGWRKALEKEYFDMMKRGFWQRIKKLEVPKDSRTIGSKWVFKCKGDGRFRARVCGLGYTQIAGVEFNANFAAVVNDITFRLLLVMKMMMN